MFRWGMLSGEKGACQGLLRQLRRRCGGPLLFAGLLALGTPPVLAHDLKALASRLVLPEPGGKTTIYLSWGHRLPIDELLDANSLSRYELLAPTGKPLPLAKSGLSLQLQVVELPAAGVYQVLAERKPGVFTFVFDEEGNRLLKRGPKSAVQGGQIDYALRSLQTAKALIVVGSASEPVKAAGLPVEIVPQEGPAQWRCGAALHVQVLLEGKPLPGAELLARYVGFKPDQAWCYGTTSNRQGIAEFRPSQPGTWVLKAHSRRLAQEAQRSEYDWESFSTTLTLEVQP